MNYQARVDDPEIVQMRLDSFLSDSVHLLSRSQLKNRVLAVLINGKPAKLSKRISFGDLLDVRVGPAPVIEMIPEELPLNILYEDESCIVIDKARGVVVHPAAGNETGTLAQALLFHCGTIQSEFNDERPGVVHRLDKETTGIIIAAKTREAQAFLARQFKDRSVVKRYAAVLRGSIVPTAGVIDRQIGRDPSHRKRFKTLDVGGKPSVTSYRIVSHYAGYSLATLMPQTGRTHQLRVHLQHRGAPILGDRVYGRVDSRHPLAPLMLHACSLEITLPGEHQPRRFLSTIPEDFRETLQSLR